MKTLKWSMLFLFVGIQHSAVAQDAPKNKDDHREVFFSIANDTKIHEARKVTHVVGQGSLSPEIVVTDERPIKNRKLQLYLAIFRRDVNFPSRFKPAEFVTSYLDKDMMVTEGPKPGLARTYRSIW